MRFNIILALFIFISVLLCQIEGVACSMYKVSVDGHTMVGCNEDAWRTASRIWFVNATHDREYGATFTGSRQVGPNRFTPQSGMNEAGLVFSRLSAFHPRRNGAEVGLKPVQNEADYLSDILHQCATVDEVAGYVEKFDRSFFIGDVFIYVDSTGNYLIVEPYELIRGNKASFVLSNFCPSITLPAKANQLERYRNGAVFLEKHELKVSLDYCRALSDTMHVCRSRNGDGTLLSTIWDTFHRRVNVYFYHDYDSTIQFVLGEELSKGDHMLVLPDLFPTNAEFEQLKSYITPFNTPVLRITLVVFGGLLTLFALTFGVLALRTWRRPHSARAILWLAGLNLLLTTHLAVLATNISVYYFDAPYQHYSSGLINATSYIPFLLLIASWPIAVFTTRSFKSKDNRRWFRTLLVANNVIFIILVCGYGYWGLFNVMT